MTMFLRRMFPITFFANHKKNVFLQSIIRDVAQSGSVRRSGRRGRRFKSCHPDRFKI